MCVGGVATAGAEDDDEVGLVRFATKAGSWTKRREEICIFEYVL